MSTLKVDTIKSDTTPTVTISDGLSVTGVTTSTGDISIADTIVHTGDTNTKIRFPSADTISAETGGSERLRVTSTGQVKIGNDPTMDSNANLHVEDASGECGVWIEGNTGGAGAYLLLKNNSTSSNPKTYIGGVDAGGQGISQIEFHNLDNGTNEGAMSLHTRPASGSMTERLRIDSSGRLLIGLTAAVSLPYSTYGAIQTQGAYNTSSINIINNENSGNTSALTFNKIRASSAAGGSDTMGGINWGAYDGSAWRSGVTVEGKLTSIGSNAVPSKLIFKVNSGSSNTERFAITPNGVTFNGDTAAANALDDYEEGTWTPVLKNGSNTITHTTNDGSTRFKYTKIGRLVHLMFSLNNETTAGTTGGSSAFEITGTPFVPANERLISAPVLWYSSGLRINQEIFLHLHTSGTLTAYRMVSASGGYTSSNCEVEQVGGGSYMFWQLTYETNS